MRGTWMIPLVFLLMVVLALLILDQGRDDTGSNATPTQTILPIAKVEEAANMPSGPLAQLLYREEEFVVNLEHG